MQANFKKFIETHQLQQKKIVVAVSGGVDSMVLAQLCLNSKLDFALAHCNFQLRGAESDLDEELVIQWAKQNNVLCFVKKMPTKDFAQSHKISTQIAARQLRYKWFEELLIQHEMQYVFTAHHADDDVETFLINFTRGTGLKGLLGIPEHNQKVLRPLLSCTKEEVVNFAKTRQVPWREDASNATHAYLRNRVRHQIIPLLKEENPSFLSSFQQTQQHLADADYLLEEYTNLLFQKIVEKKSKAYILKIEEIQKFSNPRAILFQLLKDFNFTAWNDVVDLLKAENGKRVPGPHHWLTKDRDFLVLTEKNQFSEEKGEIQIQNSKELVNFGDLILRISKTTGILQKSKQYAYFLESDLAFPLKLRKWKPTDVFIPFGKNTPKKVSDFLKDEKVPQYLRDEVWVLMNKNDIIWVVGYRTSQKYRIKTAEKQCIQFKLSSNKSY